MIGNLSKKKGLVSELDNEKITKISEKVSESMGYIFESADNKIKTGENVSPLAFKPYEETSDDKYPSEKYVKESFEMLKESVGIASDMAQGALGTLDTKEDVSNKVTYFSESLTDEQYPSAKAVYNADRELQFKINDVRMKTDVMQLRLNQSNQARSFEDYNSFCTYVLNYGEELSDSRSNNYLPVGNNIMIKTIDVPDLWVYGHISKAVTVIPSDDEIITMLKTDGYFDIGYLRIAQLETQKVDLSEYYTKETVDSKENELKLADERLKYYGDKDIVPSPESYFTVNETGETITGLTDEGKTQTELVIPYKIEGKKIAMIGQSAFSNCTSLNSVNVPNNITMIGNGAFVMCTSLTSINIPNSVTSIGYASFSGTSLNSINIPDSITSINQGTFGGCTSLTSINIPNSVTSIERNAFIGCSALTSINIPSNVTSIGDDAFHMRNEAGDNIPLPNLTIYCEQGSYADTYAKTNNIPVVYTEIKDTTLDSKADKSDTYTKTEVDTAIQSAILDSWEVSV